MTDLAIPEIVSLDTLTPEETLRWAILGFLARYRVKTTRAGYELALREWCAWCDEHDVDALRPHRAQIEIYARHLEEQRRLKLSTVAAKLNALAGFFKYARADELIDRNPMDHVARPKIPRESTTLGMTRPELDRVLAAAENDGLQTYALICVLAYNGLRISEALGINVEDFGGYRGQQTVQIVRKGGKVQHIPFANETAWAISQWLDGRTEGPLFISGYGNRMDGTAANRIVHRVVLAAGITRRITCHSFRHTFVTLARDAGATDRDIIASTGHADGRMVDYYDRAKDKIDRNVTHLVAAFVGRAR